jgi:hypothetical protein
VKCSYDCYIIVHSYCSHTSQYLYHNNYNYNNNLPRRDIPYSGGDYLLPKMLKDAIVIKKIIGSNYYKNKVYYQLLVGSVMIDVKFN